MRTWLWKIPTEKWPFAKERQLTISKFQTLVWQPKSNRAKKTRERRWERHKRIKQKWIGTSKQRGLYNYIHKTKQLIVLEMCDLNHVICDGGGTVFVPFFFLSLLLSLSFSLIHSITFIINRKFSSVCVCCHHHLSEYGVRSAERMRNNRYVVKINLYLCLFYFIFLFISFFLCFCVTRNGCC